MGSHFKADPPIGDKPATGKASQLLLVRHALVFAAGLVAMFAVALAYKWFFVAG
jgi:hypothetical protein